MKQSWIQFALLVWDEIRMIAGRLSGGRVEGDWASRWVKRVIEGFRCNNKMDKWAVVSAGWINDGLY